MIIVALKMYVISYVYFQPFFAFPLYEGNILLDLMFLVALEVDVYTHMSYRLPREGEILRDNLCSLASA